MLFGLDRWLRSPNWKRYGLALIFLMIGGLVFWASKHLEIIDCAQLKEGILAWGPWAPLYLCMLYVLATLGFFPGIVLTLASGMTFGLVGGTLIVLVGATIGSVLAFLIARFFLRDSVEKHLKSKAWFQKFANNVEKDGFNYILFVRLVPLFPFTGINFASGILPIKLKHYLYGSFFGMAPGTFAYVYLGEAGCKLIDPILGGTFEISSIPMDLLFKMGLAIAFLAFLAGLPLILKYRQKKGL